MPYDRRKNLSVLLGLAMIVALAPGLSFAAELNRLMFVVSNSSNPTNEDDDKIAQFQSWGYTVTVVDDGASQASMDSAAGSNDVAYVSSTVNASTVGTKLKNFTIGVVDEHHNLADEFGFSDTSSNTRNANYIKVLINTHYITYGLSIGNVTILSSNQSLSRRTGTLASGATTLAETEANSSPAYNPGMLVLEVGAALSGGGTATGRRVLLPVGGSGFDYTLLNSTGLQVFRRAIEWAARPNPALGDVLLVVSSTSSPTSQEVMRQMQIDVWGYNVTLIDDDANQSSFNTALSGKEAVYIAEDVNPASVSTKLVNTTIGVVSEEPALSDEFDLSTTNSTSSVTAISITDNSHYITSPFSTGSLTVFTSSQSAGTITGSFAAGLQTLATVSGSKGLAVVETGAVLVDATVAPGRRVQMPWGGSTFDFSAANSDAKTIMRRAIEWAATPSGTRMLFVVADSNTLSSQEQSRKTLLESWNYSVNIIDDGASQATYDAAILANTVAYISEEADSGSFSSKLRSAAIGVVNEEPAANDEFGVSSGMGTTTGSSLTISNGTHYITQTLGAGSVTIFTSSQPVAYLSGTFAPEMQVLAQWGANRSLVAIENGAELYDGSTAAGRRVQLPWGDGAFDFTKLNANGQTLLRRSLQWASGLVGYWKLDETSGSTASDYSGYRNHGTVAGGLAFTTDSVDPGKVGRGLMFNGSSDYISINNATSLQPTSALTIAAWVKGDTWGTSSYVNTILRKGEDNPNNWQLAIAGGGKVQLSLDDNDDAGFRGNTTLQTGTWYHVAATWDGTTVRIYVNGTLDRNPPQTHSSPIGSDSRTVYLGGRSGSTDLFDGVLDEVRIYNYALDASEITALKGHGQPNGIRVLKWVEVQ